MVRAAAKNHDAVAIVVDPEDYDSVLGALRSNDGLTASHRRSLARKAFAHTAAYDAAIVSWFDETDPEIADDALPSSIHISLDRVHDLRYGENPHQNGARYRFTHGSGWWDSAIIHQGKEMSYLNVYDTEAAWSLVNSLAASGPAAVVMKHANPCGPALGSTIEEAYARAHAGDTISAFGGVVAANRPVTAAMATELSLVFTEVVVAPSFDAGALEILAAKKNLRLVEVADQSWAALPLQMRTIAGGMLVQHDDVMQIDTGDWQSVTEREPTEQEMVDLIFAWRVAARVTSNTIVLVKTDRLSASELVSRTAATPARSPREKGGRPCCWWRRVPAMHSFRSATDSMRQPRLVPQRLSNPADRSATTKVIDAANEQGMAMMFTGRRHFRH